MTINADGSSDDLAPASGGQRFCAWKGCGQTAVVFRVLDVSQVKSGDLALDRAMEKPLPLCDDHARRLSGVDVAPPPGE